MLVCQAGGLPVESSSGAADGWVAASLGRVRATGSGVRFEGGAAGEAAEAALVTGEGGDAGVGVEFRPPAAAVDVVGRDP